MTRVCGDKFKEPIITDGNVYACGHDYTTRHNNATQHSDIQANPGSSHRYYRAIISVCATASSLSI